MPPRAARSGFTVKDGERPLGATQKIAGRETGLAAAEDQDIQNISHSVSLRARAARVTASTGIVSTTPTLK
ncbi:hypothetical protein D3C80_1495850 [compost metagenome]